jgi:hypothetical protein
MFIPVQDTCEHMECRYVTPSAGLDLIKDWIDLDTPADIYILVYASKTKLSSQAISRLLLIQATS